MLFNKSIFAVAVMALANVVAAGTNSDPVSACLLKIIGGTDNPGDTKAICGADASKIQSQISKDCGDKDVKFFINNCAELGHKVESSSTTAEKTATGTSGSSTATGFVTAASSGSSATQTGSSAGSTGTSSSGSASSSGSSSGSSSSSGSGSSTGSAGGSSPSPTFNAAASDRKFDATTFAAAVFIGAAALL
ncbi:hypothetical protein N7541_011191 [Penicillium brevicompactum]|uniref:GPI anchored cell wall protein n=1 Tax=Penicillium brevicompactum TaxID=5074 RepID=A0A9W9UIC6_PENBR|nr:hypothetical protein N7541_011191 [Penicillium brevicompactum]